MGVDGAPGSALPAADEAAHGTAQHDSVRRRPTEKKKKKKRSDEDGDGGEGVSSSAWWEEMAHQVSVVYSSEQQKVSLLPLPEGMAAGELGSQPHFRVRVLPVLPPLPAAVGAALAAHALSRLSGRAVAPAPRPVPTLSMQ